MGQTVMIASGKGGVGKTTVTANLCACLAMTGKKVIAIDMDLGLRSLDLSLGMSNSVYDICDAANGGCNPFEAAVRHPYINGLSFIAASVSKGFDDISAGGLKTVVDNLSDRFDYVVLDVPAGIGRGFELAASVCKKGILVATPDINSARDAEKAAAKLRGFGVNDIRLVINRARPYLTKKGLSMNIDDLIDASGIQLIGAIPEDERFVISQAKGKLLVENKRLLAGKEIFDIAKRLDGEQIPLKRFW